MRAVPIPTRFIALALAASVLLIYAAPPPNFTDAYYHFNAAARFASGQGLTDPYLWNYIAATGALPQPSHLYWMPFTSLTAAGGMALLNAPGDTNAARLLFVPMLTVVICVGFWLGQRLGGRPVYGWQAGFLSIASGFFAGFWGAIDTFTPYAFAGSLCLLTLGLALESRRAMWWLVGGAAAAVGHLTRADGLLLLGVGLVMALWVWDRITITQRLGTVALLSAAYLIVMAPWFMRNWIKIGSPLPVGGAQAIWFRTYDELFSAPPEASPQTLFADGLDVFFTSRWLALTSNLTTFIVVEGWVVLTPFMLLGLWQRRRVRLLRPFMLYALGLHVAMTFVFPFPGYRGGLFHSAAALVPWWGALAVVGLHHAIDWAAKRRRWNPRSAQVVLTAGSMVLALALTIFGILRVQGVRGDQHALYAELQQRLAADSRVMINDPAGLYYHTRLSGIVLPNEAPEAILGLAEQYGIDYVVIEFQLLDDGGRAAAIPEPLMPLLNDLPAFLTALPLDYPHARLYAIDRQHS